MPGRSSIFFFLAASFPLKGDSAGKII